MPECHMPKGHRNAGSSAGSQGNDGTREEPPVRVKPGTELLVIASTAGCWKDEQCDCKVAFRISGAGPERRFNMYCPGHTDCWVFLRFRFTKGHTVPEDKLFC